MMRKDGNGNMVELGNADLQTMVLLLAILQLIGFIVLVILLFSLMSTKKKLRKIFKSSKIENVEELIIHHQKTIEETQRGIKENRREIDNVLASLRKIKGKVGILRYNAFGTDGSDLSYSIAIMNDEQTGVVLTGLHNRDQTYMYAKPILKGQSNYSLSGEEKEAMVKALESE
jgi:hypothetical protein